MADGAQEEVGAGGKALAMVEQARSKLSAMPAHRRSWMMGGCAMLLAMVAGMVWYAQRPDYRVLFSGLEGKDVQQVAQELGAAGIPFQMTPDGTGVEVPADLLDKSRIEVASKGMPQSGRLGFELFDKPNWVGSEFDERVNYQRALEGELEHTIGTLGVVRSARVHLVLPQASLFASEPKVAKASVVLKLKRASITADETESIRNLVAGAVENLNPSQVTLVDADGRVSLEAKGRLAQAGDEEREMESRLVAMLEPLAGPGNIRSTVNISYDDGSEEHTDEVYDPTQTATLSSQKSEQTTGHGRVASGIPGTASNAPAAAPVGAVQGSDKAAAPGTPPLLQTAAKEADRLPVFPENGNGQGQSTKEESGTYAVTRHLIHTEHGPGRVRRVTAAVVVNDRTVSEGTGKLLKTIWKPRSSDEMRRLEQLAQAAVGFDEQRGDQVVMQNVSFSTNVAEQEPTATDKAIEQARGLLGTQPGLLRTGVAGLLGLLVVLVVLRPVAGQMVSSLREPLLLTGHAPATLGAENRAFRGDTNRAELAGSDPLGFQSSGSPGSIALEEPEAVIFDEVTDHIKRDPAHSTRLLEAWIAADGDD
jgi:flagellar M-ring protein FliF